ncbi:MULTISPECIES: hypothetical protein [unclassified Lysobacter]
MKDDNGRAGRKIPRFNRQSASHRAGMVVRPATFFTDRMES